ncbi:unnamed protein product [Chondrus crispus]|uniref:Uncharacterized protein n=1 Tax=Chondrus crispus TaxID=2769 RepID=R7QBI9_CHOCR|nr:unnamed protein product [Chondrus crispus]CDF35872.1 unnamed protein product [Chondrus crispus]|eukprot:XP_005715691.1 unnamed protein product [Chondrus crispus]
MRTLSLPAPRLWYQNSTHGRRECSLHHIAFSRSNTDALIHPHIRSLVTSLGL